MKIVLTGGPSAGKTALATIVGKEFHDKVTVVPESASILFRGGYPRGVTNHQIIHQQRAIFHVQVELENVICEDNPDKVIVCDRGTLDGLAYWPGKEADFFESVHTNFEKELARYDWVIHLETPSESFYDTSDPIRIEKAAEAKRLDEKIKTSWSRHSNRIVIANATAFSQKIMKGLDAFDRILAGIKV